MLRWKTPHGICADAEVGNGGHGRERSAPVESSSRLRGLPPASGFGANVPPSIMIAFVLQRLGQAALVMLAVGLIAFSLFRFVGDPVVFMLGQDAPPEARVQMT